MRKRVSSGTKWEDVVGYSRAVRAGNVVEVSGTTAVDGDGTVIGEGDAYLQTDFIIRKIEKALVALGSSLDHVVRTRMYVTDINRWEEIGRAHGEHFGGTRPATAMIEVKALIDRRLLVEIEATAIIPEV